LDGTGDRAHSFGFDFHSENGADEKNGNDESDGGASDGDGDTGVLEELAEGVLRHGRVGGVSGGKCFWERVKGADDDLAGADVEQKSRVTGE
jgi:hypothetical protein